MTRMPLKPTALLLTPALLAMALIGVAAPAEAHSSYVATEKITGVVTNTHYVRLPSSPPVGLLPDAVTFTWTKDTVFDCRTGEPIFSSPPTVEYAGAFIDGKDGIYILLGQYWVGAAGASAGGVGAGVSVTFAVSGQSGLGWTHSFGGSGIGDHERPHEGAPGCASPKWPQWGLALGHLGLNSHFALPASDGGLGFVAL